ETRPGPAGARTRTPPPHPPPPGAYVATTHHPYATCKTTPATPPAAPLCSWSGPAVGWNRRKYSLRQLVRAFSPERPRVSSVCRYMGDHLQRLCRRLGSHDRGRGCPPPDPWTDQQQGCRQEQLADDQGVEQHRDGQTN